MIAIFEALLCYKIEGDLEHGQVCSAPPPFIAGGSQIQLRLGLYAHLDTHDSPWFSSLPHVLIVFSPSEDGSGCTVYDFIDLLQL